METDNIKILIADDDPDDRLLIKDAFREINFTNQIYEVTNGVELLEYLNNDGKFLDKIKYPKPALILLDLNMPKKSGNEALKEIKAKSSLKAIPIVAFTTSKNEDDILKTYRLGASGFITKPDNFDELTNIMKSLSKYWLNTVQLPKP